MNKTTPSGPEKIAESDGFDLTRLSSTQDKHVDIASLEPTMQLTPNFDTKIDDTICPTPNPSSLSDLSILVQNMV